MKEGRRVWLGEVLALAPLANDAALASLVLPKTSEEPPPIPVKFTLPEAGVVTLVIEDKQNHRVRNLVSETPFPAGENIAWWDGSDDLLRDPEAAKHGVYHIPTRPVAPGTYKVRGLWHQPLKLRYEFSIYNAGKPAWDDGRQHRLLADHAHAADQHGLRARQRALPTASRWFSWARSSPRGDTACNGCAKTARSSAGKAGSAAPGPARRRSRWISARRPWPIISATSARSGKANCG